jgi:hypothetical protein
MSDIKNITLAFPCHQQLTRNGGGEFYCNACAQTIVDFRCQSAGALAAALRQSSRPVCGIFNSSQLSQQFVRYAAATAIAVSAATGTMCTSEPQLDEPSGYLGLVFRQSIKGIPLFIHPRGHGFGRCHALPHLVHRFDVCSVTTLHHLPGMVAHQHGNLVKAVGAECFITGAAQLFASHRFHNSALKAGKVGYSMPFWNFFELFLFHAPPRHPA